MRLLCLLVTFDCRFFLVFIVTMTQNIDYVAFLVGSLILCMFTLSDVFRHYTDITDCRLACHVPTLLTGRLRCPGNRRPQ